MSNQKFEFSQKQIAEYKEAFALFDRDGDGKISASELGIVMRAVGHSPSQAELDEMISEVDIDGSGSIEFSEFLIMMARKIQDAPGSLSEQARAMFRSFDTDGNGFITPKELKAAMAKMGEDLTMDEVCSGLTSFFPL